MGLDITYYTELKPATESDDNFCASAVGYTDKNFPGRTAPLEADKYYSYVSSGRFRAGSYGGYNAWRNQLAQLAGYGTANSVWENNTEGAFTELINFSDCEGVIGGETCAKLGKDFQEFRQTAEASGGYFFELYCQWQAAFESAANNGAVSFH